MIYQLIKCGITIYNFGVFCFSVLGVRIHNVCEIR